MEENALITMLADNVAKWKKLVVEIEKEKSNFIQGEDKLFQSLRDFWKKNNFAPEKCKQLLNEIAVYKAKHPTSDFKENLQEFRGLCNNYYTKDKAVFEAFQGAMGGESVQPPPPPPPKPKQQPPPPPPPKPRQPPPPILELPDDEPWQERPYESNRPEYKKNKKSFPGTILIVGILLLLCVGGAIGYYQYYLPYVTDRDAPRYYTYAATNTFLRSSQMSGVDYNILVKIPYGSELIVYNNKSEWSEVKWNTTKGFISSPLILPKRDFYLLNSIWGDIDSREIINTVKCRMALLGYFKSNGYYGVIDEQIRQEVFTVDSITPDLVWQVFSKQKDSKTNTTYYKRVTDKNSKFTDFAIIIKNPNTSERKCLLFSFSEDETPHLEYEEYAPATGDIVSIESGVRTVRNGTDEPDRAIWYRIESR
jgi:hypothetical protein